MRRILQVMGCLECGGTEKIVMDIYKNIDRTQVQFDFYILNPNYMHFHVDEIKNMGGRVFCGKNFNIGNIGSALKLMRRTIKKYGPYDAVHCHTNISNAWPLFVAYREKINIRISHSHAVYTLKNTKLKRIYNKFLKYLICKYSTKCLACSEIAGKSLYGEKTFKEKGVVINNGINIQRYSNEKENDEIFLEYPVLKQSKLIFANITRFDENKNQIFILEIFKEILNYEPNSCLILGGPDAGMLSAVKQKIIDLALDKNVILLGARNDVEKWLSVCNIYLFPSIKEGFGIALIEAQAAQCKCFTSTGVPNSVDLGIGLMWFLDLKYGAKHWARTIMDNVDANFPDKKTIVSSLRDKGFDIHSTVQKIFNIYKIEE